MNYALSFVSQYENVTYQWSRVICMHTLVQIICFIKWHVLTLFINEFASMDTNGDARIHQVMQQRKPLQVYNLSSHSLDLDQSLCTLPNDRHFFKALSDSWQNFKKKIKHDGKGVKLFDSLRNMKNVNCYCILLKFSY